MVKFLEMAERRGGMVEGVRDLCVSARKIGDSSALRRLLKSTPHVLNLLCHGGTIMVGDLARLQMFRRLELVYIDVIGSPSSSLLCLPNLQRLSMTDVTLEDSPSHFLTPAFLPRLRHIDTDDLGSFAPLIAQLEIIGCDSDYSGYADYTLLSRAKSLLLLPLSRYPGDRFAMFSNLPSLPLFLHIDFTWYTHIGVDHEVPIALEELLEAKNSGLRVILLNDHGINDSSRSLIQRLEERGIRVQLLDEYRNFDGAIVEMEKIRAEEKRAVEEAVMRGK